MSKIREKESLECGRMHIWTLKTQKFPGPLSGPWTPAANCLLHSCDSASLCRQLSVSKPALPLDQILDLFGFMKNSTVLCQLVLGCFFSKLARSTLRHLKITELSSIGKLRGIIVIRLLECRHDHKRDQLSFSDLNSIESLESIEFVENYFEGFL